MREFVDRVKKIAKEVACYDIESLLKNEDNAIVSYENGGVSVTILIDMFDMVLKVEGYKYEGTDERIMVNYIKYIQEQV